MRHRNERDRNDRARGADLRLGLIGDNIAASSAPRLHRLAGARAGLDIRYDRLVPAALGLDFDALLARCAAEGRRGVNVTYPYKERAAASSRPADPTVAAMGAVNTVIFAPPGASDPRPTGHNTDCSGFVAAWRAAMTPAPCDDASPPPGPGVVCLIGAGGVGRAAAFGLAELGAAGLRICDRDPAKAAALAGALAVWAPGLAVTRVATAEAAAEGAHGVVNCTPTGMVGHPGAPIRAAALQGARWAFDAVYTPLETDFLAAAKTQGLRVISGYELFFHQGLHAFRLFTGRRADPAALRADLAAPPACDDRDA